MLLHMQATACPFCNRPLPRCSVCLMTLGIIPDSARNGQLAHYNAPMRGMWVFTGSCGSAYELDGILQTVLTTQSYSVKPVGMADMLHTSWNGFTAKLARSHAEPVLLQIVITDVLMNSEQQSSILQLISYHDSPTSTIAGLCTGYLI